MELKEQIAASVRIIERLFDTDTSAICGTPFERACIEFTDNFITMERRQQQEELMQAWRTKTDDARAQYLARFETLSDAMEFESQCLGIGREFLPECAIRVLECAEGYSCDSPEYYVWLESQLDDSQVEECENAPVGYTLTQRDILRRFGVRTKADHVRWAAAQCPSILEWYTEQHGFRLDLLTDASAHTYGTGGCGDICDLLLDDVDHKINPEPFGWPYDSYPL